MSDDSTKIAEDRNLISLAEAELRAAVKAVGHSAQAVRSYLANR